MARVLKYNDFDSSVKMAEELIDSILNPKLNESNISNEHLNKILKGLSIDLKFNYGLVFTFGAGIKAIYPVVDNLIRNSTIKVDITPENIVLLSIAALAVTYLEEKNNKTGEEKIECPDCVSRGVDCPNCDGKGYIVSKVTRADARTILEELKLRGFGNGIVKKMVSCLKSIGNIVKIIFKNTPYIISGILDMFAYTAILIPTMNAISALVGNYNLDMDTLPGNFLSLGVGVVSFFAKNGFNYLVKRLKDKLDIKLNPDIDVPTAVKPYDLTNVEQENDDENKLIKEQ